MINESNIDYQIGEYSFNIEPQDCIQSKGFDSGKKREEQAGEVQGAVLQDKSTRQVIPLK